MLEQFTDYVDEFEREVHIDINNLGGELFQQPSRYVKWSQRWASAVKTRDHLKGRLEVVRAEVELLIREFPEDYDVKITEATVKALIEVDQKVIAAKSSVHDANEQVNNLFSAKNAFEQRKSMLNDVVQIFKTGYWGELNVPDVTPVIEKHADTKMKKTLNESPRMKRLKERKHGKK